VRDTVPYVVAMVFLGADEEFYAGPVAACSGLIAATTTSS
jgi:hypothetical protein